MKSKIKRSVLHALRSLGFFSLARYLTRKRLRILAYHVISVDDQYVFEDILFMRPDTFRRRMQLLKKWGFPVLSLRDAVDGLAAQTLPDDALAITIDDGWYTTFSEQVPALRELGFPATIYVTSYYVEKGTEIFNVFARYAFWKVQAGALALADVDLNLTGTFDLSKQDDRNSALAAILKRGDQLDAPGRQNLVAALASRLNLDFPRILKSRMFQLVSADEIRNWNVPGIDLQLHTHRHQLSKVEQSHLEMEIRENRVSLERLGLPQPLDQFCYPSGVHDRRQGGWLRDLGIHNATTCLPGFNDEKTDKYFLKRFLDREKISDIEFQAEMFGVMEFFRMARNLL